MPGLNDNTLFLLHCNGINGSQVFTDSSPLNHIPSIVAGNTHIDATDGVFGGACGVWDGNGDYLTYPFHYAWNTIFNDITQNGTIDFRIKTPTLTGGEQKIFIHEHNVNPNLNFWFLQTFSGGGFQIYGRWNGTGTNWMNGCTATGLITANTWHHICFVKIANVGAWYSDGIQKAYTDSLISTPRNTLGVAHIGRNYTGAVETHYLNAKLDEFRIQETNYFNAHPNAELTDTIIVPTKQYSEKIKKNRVIIIP